MSPSIPSMVTCRNPNPNPSPNANPTPNPNPNLNPSLCSVGDRFDGILSEILKGGEWEQSCGPLSRFILGWVVGKRVRGTGVGIGARGWGSRAHVKR